MSTERVTHHLKVNHSTRLPRRIIYVDVEPEIKPNPAVPLGTLHTFKRGAAVVVGYRDGVARWRMPWTFDSPAGFWDVAVTHLHPKRLLWVYAYNLGYRATLLNFWDSFLDPRITLPMRVYNDPPCMFHVLTPRGRAVLCDTLNYWRVGLSGMENMVDVPSVQRREVSGSRHTELGCLESRLKCVEAAVSNLIALCGEQDLGNWQMSAPGLAFSAYRHRFMPTVVIPDRAKRKKGGDPNAMKRVGIIRVHDNWEALALERQAIRGGRADCFFCGRVNERVIHLDVNSLYPYCAHEHPFPYQLVHLFGPMKPTRLKAILRTFAAVAEVELDDGDYEYPAVRHGAKLFAHGSFRAVLCGPELSVALDRLSVRRILRVAVYRADYLFRSYVEHFYAARLRAKDRGDLSGDSLNKLFLNSLLGKFSQKGSEWEPVRGVRPLRDYGQWWQYDQAERKYVRYRATAGEVDRRKKAGEWQHSFPAITAYVQSYARVHMERLRRLCGRKEVYYMDTDSLHVSEPAYEMLKGRGEVHPTALGKLKLVGSYPQAEYRGIRDYTLGSRRVTAGLKADARQAAGNTFLQDQQQGLPSILSRNPHGQVAVCTWPVRFDNSYYQGRVQPDGWIEPITLRD